MDYRLLVFPTLVFASFSLGACNKSAATNDPVPASAVHVRAPITAAASSEVRAAAQATIEAKVVEGLERLHEPAWALITTSPEPIDFAPLDRGVVLTTGEQTLVLDEGELIAAPAKALTRGMPRGSWPDNAWVTKIRSEERAGLYIRMSKWKGNKRWVPQPIKDTPESLWEDGGKWYGSDGEFWANVGGRGGYLLATFDWDAEAITFRRLAGENFAPVDWAWDYEEDDTPYELVEAPSGRLFAFSRDREGSLRVDERAFCRQRCKVERHELPKAARDAYPSRSVALDDDHIVLGLRLDYDSVAASRLLIGGMGEWSADAAPVADEGFHDFLPGAAGELFAVVGGVEEGASQSLWHRDVAGEWELVELPEAVAAEGTQLELARVDEDTLWVAVNDAETHAVYALPVVL